KIVQARLRVQDSASWRCRLAVGYSYSNNFEPVEEQLRQALQLDPKECTALLCMAAYKMTYGEKEQLKEVTELLERAGNIIENEEWEQHRLHYAYLQGIYLGLIGETSGAKEKFTSVFAKDPKMGAALDGLKALEK